MKQIRTLNVLFIGNTVLLIILFAWHLLTAANTDPRLSGIDSANHLGKLCGITAWLLSVSLLVSFRIWNRAAITIGELRQQIADLKAQAE